MCSRAPPERARPPGRARRLRLQLHEVRTLLKLAGPIIVSQLGGVAMNTTDTIMVAPLGPEALAAAGLGTSVHMALLVTLSGTLMGMTPVVRQAWGAGDPVNLEVDVLAKYVEAQLAHGGLR